MALCRHDAENLRWGIFMSKMRDIRLVNLLVNTENYRYESVKSQKEAIDQMVSEQSDKLFKLAEHICENGFNPNEKIQVSVSSHNPKEYIVLEGNRRIVSLKLLNHPDLIDSATHSGLRKKFRKLHEAKKADLIKEVECLIYDSPEEAEKWIKLKHAGQLDGIGTVAWNAQQIQRFEEKVENKSSIALQTINLLKTSPDVPSEIKSNLNKLKITNLDRLLSDPDVRDMLGIEIDNGKIQSEVEQKEVIKGLTQVAKDLLHPNFNVKKIYTKVDRKDYIDNFHAKSKPNVNKKAQNLWQFIDNASVQAKPKSKSKLKTNPSDRDHLIPKSCAMQINNAKVNAIYHELKKLNVSKFTNATAVLLRVFIELSMDCYIEHNKVSTANINSYLVTKVTEVANHLETQMLANKYVCKGIRSAVNNKNDLLGIETWHAYVHNSKFQPTASNLLTTWDNLQDFMKILWENVK